VGEIAGYIASILIGVSLGLVGSGGSILTVPVLVYLMGMDPLLATTSSLFIVGITSLVGGIRAYSKKQIDFRTITEFGIPSIFSVFITRHFLLPAIPETLFTIGSFALTKGMFLMIVFALLMLGASITMIKSPDPVIGSHEKHKTGIGKSWLLVFLGLGVGVVTGLLGAGGGFLIIPVLVLILGTPMKKAVGTSLLLVAINSLFGFLFSIKHFEFNWFLLLGFSILALAGLFLGFKLAEKMSGKSLKKYFGWFVLIMAVYILVKELYTSQAG
jgi:uncharacterized membrane protein YfcA